MPKRMLDDSFLSSPSLAKCSPRAQDAFPRFILLMDDFGCSEANPRVLLGKGWPLRDDVTERDVWGWLEEYVGAGMACLWTENERRYVHLTGWFGPHGQRRRVEYDPTSVAGQKGSKRRTPAPPADLVAAVAAGVRRDHDGKPPGVDREDDPETSNGSAPAREITGKFAGPAAGPVDSRTFPAPAVAVPVADAGSPLPPRAPDPLAAKWPLIAAVLAALWERGVDALWPAEEATANRLERAIGVLGIPTSVERLAGSLTADPGHPWLGWHIDALKAKPPKRPESDRWQDRLTADEFHMAHAELRALHPDLADAPLGCTGDPAIHPIGAIAALNAKYRAIAEAR